MAREVAKKITYTRYAISLDKGYTQIYGIGLSFFDRFCATLSSGNIAAKYETD